MNESILKSAIVLFTATVFISCGGSEQSGAFEQAKETREAIQQNMPGGIPVSTNGYAMRAKINGQDWEAATVMPVDAAGRIIGDSKGELIGLPLYGGKEKLVQGHKTTFSEEQVVDLMTNDDIGMWGGNIGEMEITKIDEHFAEGKFYFTARSRRSEKKMEVTKGYFRIPLAKDN